MRVSYQAAEQNKCPNGKKSARRQGRAFTDLDRKTEETFRPLFNTEGMGYWYIGCPYAKDGDEDKKPGPRFSIPQHHWELFRRYKDGEQDLRYEEGRRKGEPFNPRTVYARAFKTRDVADAIDGLAKPYYTGGIFGFTLFTNDLDAHDGEPDLAELRADMEDLFGTDYFPVESDHGVHLDFKLDYRGVHWTKVNAALGWLDQLIKEYALLRGRQAVPEIKGKPSGDRQHYGTLCKVPFYKDWNEQRLEQFRGVPFKSWRWLNEVIAKIDAKIQALKAAGAVVKQAAPAPTSATPAATNGAPQARRTPGPKRKPGSCLGVAIPEQDFARLEEAIRWRKNQPMTDHVYAMRPEMRTRNNELRDIIVTRGHVAEYMAVMDLCSAHLKNKQEGDFPQKFAQQTWTLAYEQGIVSSAWNDHRWKCVRDAAWDCGYCDVRDTDYWWYDVGHPERGHGQCMKWLLRDEFSFFGKKKVGGEGMMSEGALPVPKYVKGLYRSTNIPPPPYRDPKAEERRRRAQERWETEALVAGIVEPGLAWEAYAGDTTGSARRR
jgi:hypothetical protein